MRHCAYCEPSKRGVIFRLPGDKHLGCPTKLSTWPLRGTHKGILRFFGFSKGLYTGTSATDAQDTLFIAGISVCLPDLRHAFFAKQGQAFLTTHSNIEALSHVRIASALWLYGRRIQEYSVFRLSIMIIVCCLTQPVSCTPSKEHSSENINI